jgi:hypothetical protein
VKYPFPERTPEGEDPAGGGSLSYEKDKASCVPGKELLSKFHFQGRDLD